MEKKTIYFIRKADSIVFSYSNDFVATNFENAIKSFPLTTSIEDAKADVLKSLDLKKSDVTFTEEELKAVQFFDKWSNRMKNIHRITFDKKKVEKKFVEYYNICGYDKPSIEWHQSPSQAYDRIIKDRFIIPLEEQGEIDGDKLISGLYLPEPYLLGAIELFPTELESLQQFSNATDCWENLFIPIQSTHFKDDSSGRILYKNIQMSYIAFMDYCMTKHATAQNSELTDEERNKYWSACKTMLEIADELHYMGMFWMFGEPDTKDNLTLMLSEHPVFISYDDRNRLSNDNRRAFEYSDGFGACCCDGMAFPDNIVLDSENAITVEMIDKETNIETRRIYMRLYGIANYIQNSKAEIIDKSTPLIGILYKKPSPIRGEEDVVVVELTNSTAEPDGTFKKYFLRVPPDTKTAKAAVAWSFNMEEKDYAPAIES